MVLDPGQTQGIAADPDDDKRLVVQAQTGRWTEWWRRPAVSAPTLS